MSVPSAANSLRAAAAIYQRYAENFPDPSPERTANLTEAERLGRMADRADAWPHVPLGAYPEAPSGPDAAVVLVIEHEYGVNTTIHDSRADAERSLLEYVRAWWSAEAPEGVEFPEDDPSVGIEDYFTQYAKGEGYSITTG